MICACPACGRRTEVDSDIGDFPSRCLRCGAMVRVVTQRTAPPPTKQKPAASQPPVPTERPKRLESGALAGLLSTRRQPASPPTPQVPPPEQDPLNVTQVAARFKALRRAQSLGGFQALTEFNRFTCAVAILACVVTVTIGLHSILRPTRVKGDILKVAPPQTLTSPQATAPR